MEEESAEESWGFSRQLLALVATVLVFFFFFWVRGCWEAVEWVDGRRREMGKELLGFSLVVVLVVAPRFFFLIFFMRVFIEGKG